MVQALASRDPEAALSFLQSTNQTNSSAIEQYEHFRQESVLKLDDRRPDHAQESKTRIANGTSKLKAGILAESDEYDVRTHTTGSRS